MSLRLVDVLEQY